MVFILQNNNKKKGAHNIVKKDNLKKLPSKGRGTSVVTPNTR